MTENKLVSPMDYRLLLYNPDTALEAVVIDSDAGAEDCEAAFPMRVAGKDVKVKKVKGKKKHKTVVAPKWVQIRPKSDLIEILDESHAMGLVMQTHDSARLEILRESLAVCMNERYAPIHGSIVQCAIGLALKGLR